MVRCARFPLKTSILIAKTKIISVKKIKKPMQPVVRFMRFDAQREHFLCPSAVGRKV